jgi:hypothetical protein
LVDIPFEFVGKVASACAGAETLFSISFAEMTEYEEKEAKCHRAGHTVT